MAGFSQYGTGQRLAFAMMCVGIILCGVGAAVPHWFLSEVDLSFGIAGSIPVVGSLLDDYTVVTINVGVWVFCIDYTIQTECSSLYTPGRGTDLVGIDDLIDDDDDDDTSWIQFVRVAVCVNLALGLICGFAACCRCMCASGGKTICHGVFAFCAGGCGIFAFATMISRKDELVLNIPLLEMEMELDWAFYLYASGSCSMVLASFLLCFSVPNETSPGMVMPAPMTIVSHPVAYQNQQHVFTVPPPQPQVNQVEFQPPQAQTPMPAPSRPVSVSQPAKTLYPTAPDLEG